MAQTFRPPLAMLPVLDRAVQVLGRTLGIEGQPVRYEIMVDAGGKVVQVWPHSEPGKLTRSDLDVLTIPVEP